MESEAELKENNHSLNLIERKKITINGVKKVDSFDSEEFLIESIMGYIILKGSDLELINLNTKEGVINIKGLIYGINYVDDNLSKKQKDNSVIRRLFK